MLRYVRETGKIIKISLFSHDVMRKRKHHEAVTARLKQEAFNEALGAI